MIKIDSINPLGSNSKYKKVSDLQDTYLSRFRVNKQPEELLETFINSKVSRKFTVGNNTQLDILNYLYSDFETIINAKPRKLEGIIADFKSKNWQNEVFRNKKTTAFGKEILFALGYKERFRSNIGRGLWLTKQLNIKTCPYCNAQNTIITEKKYGKEVMKFQLDHFFPKSEFPYLSISLYNLIPSCASCNLTKSSKSVTLNEYYHPYDMNLANKSEFCLKYKPDPSKLTIKGIKKQELEINFISKHKDPLNIVEKHNEMYHINGVYNRHQDVAEELLQLAIIYSRKQASKHLKIKGLFSNEEDYYRFLLRNYAAQKDILKRPLAKFTQDIAKQLGLIK
jgi:hypothetical protein